MANRHLLLNIDTNGVCLVYSKKGRDFMVILVDDLYLDVNGGIGI